MPSTKSSAVPHSANDAGEESVTVTDHGYTTTTSTPHQHHNNTHKRGGWGFFHRGKRGGGGGGGGNHSNNHHTNNIESTPKTNNRSSAGHHNTNTQQEIATNSTTASSSITTNSNNNSHGGILKKETTDYDAIVASKRYNDPNSNTKNTTTSWLCRTKYFRNMCRSAYETIDSDHSGQIDEKELYAGLLLIHLQLGMYAGPAACRPLSRDQVHTIFLKMDSNHSGTLNENEFESIMAVLFGNVLLRVMVQWSMTLMIVPWLAQFILSCMIAIITYTTAVITNLDEHSSFFNFIELTIEGISEWIYTTMVPNWIKIMIRFIQRTLQMIPVSVWKALPLTLLSTILGIVVVPYCIFQIDHYFQTMAERHHQKQQQQQQQRNGSYNIDSNTTIISKSKSV